jgi:hypothetical protein
MIAGGANIHYFTTFKIPLHEENLITAIGTVIVLNAFLYGPTICTQLGITEHEKDTRLVP